MPSLINPLSSRLGNSRYWDSTWALSQSSNFSSLNYLDYARVKYLTRVFNSIVYRKSNMVLNKIKTVAKNNFLYILFYIRFYKITFFRKKIKELFDIEGPLKTACDNPPLFHFSAKVLKKQTRLQKQFNRFGLRNSKVSAAAIKKLKKVQNYRVTSVPLILDYVATASYQIKRTARKIKFHGYLHLTKKYLIFLFVKLIFTKYFANIVKSFLNNAIKKLSVYKTYAVVPVFVISSLSSVNSAFIANYVVSRLKMRHPVRGVLNFLMRQMHVLRKQGRISGFKLMCSGRFERRGRATYLWDHQGNTSLSSSPLEVDYHMSLVTLTNSVCAIKVWLTRMQETKKIFII